MMASVISEGDIIKDGDYVIVKLDNTLRLVYIQNSKAHFIGKRKINMYGAIGCSYGSKFEIKQDGDIVKVSDIQSTACVINLTDQENPKDNRALFDTGDSQKLTTNDIESLKASGISGEEVIQKIIENSSSFHGKTAFAKEKYLKKKQKKYLKHLTVLKPNVRLLAQMHYEQGPLKICNLRIDSLSQMLNFCNVMSGGSYMVVETVIDLLVTAVLDRMGADGLVVQFHWKPFCIHPSRQLLNALSVGESKLRSMFYNIDIQTALSLLRNVNREVPDGSSTPSPDGEKASYKLEKKEHIRKVKNILNLRSMDGLLVALKTHPANVLELLEFLDISRPFAIFSMYQEPLVDCYVRLKARGDIILLNISDTWLRNFQVMSERTHPCYVMSGHGGYLLTGFKVAPKP